MMIKIFKGLIILFLFRFPFILCAQGEAGVPFLLEGVSPNLNGMAGAFTAIPTADVYGAYYNPAQIGHFSRTSNFAIGVYPVKSKWLPNFYFKKLSFYTHALAAGYKFESKVPIHLGIGYMYTKLKFTDRQFFTYSNIFDEKFNSNESSNLVSLGVGIDYYIQINFGISYKSFYSDLQPATISPGSESRGGTAKGSAFDFGFLINSQLLKTFFADKQKDIINGYIPFLNISLGYSQSNIGDEVTYIEENQADPLPRQAKLGYGISLGLDHDFNGVSINLVNIDYSLEARDVLVNRIQPQYNDTAVVDDPRYEYKGVLGDIKIIDNIFMGKSNREIDVAKGWRIKIFDTFQFSAGELSGYGYHDFKTSGYLFGTQGLLSWLCSKYHNETLKFIADHFYLEYAWSYYKPFYFEPDEATFKGIQVRISGY